MLKHRLVLSLCLALLSASSAGASTPELRSREDRSELDVLTATQPAAVERLRSGEAALARGNPREAARLFDEGRQQVPDSALLARRHCQALAESGDRLGALAACYKAYAAGGSVHEMRALAGALTMGSATPTAGELAEATRLAESAKKLYPTQPWGYAAECDVLRRIGDKSMFRACADKLALIAPGHYETLRTQASVDKGSFTLLRGFAWATLLAGCLLTAFHALSRRRRSLVAPVLALAIVSLAASPAGAQEKPMKEPVLPPGAHSAGGFSKWRINADDPLSSVPSTTDRDNNPLEYGYHIMDLTEAGFAATKRNDHAAAARYYEALVKAVPDMSRGFMLACSAYESLGDRLKALQFCTAGVARTGARVIDFQAYARVMLSGRDPLRKDEIQELSDVVEHLKKEEASKDLANDLQCELGMRTEDAKRLAECTAVLVKKAPKDPRTLSAQLSLALAQKDLAAAKKTIDFARQNKLPPAAIARMEQAVKSAARPQWTKAFSNWRVLASFGAFGLSAAFAFVLIRRQRAASTTKPA